MSDKAHSSKCLEIVTQKGQTLNCNFQSLGKQPMHSKIIYINIRWEKMTNTIQRKQWNGTYQSVSTESVIVPSRTSTNRTFHNRNLCHKTLPQTVRQKQTVTIQSSTLNNMQNKLTEYSSLQQVSLLLEHTGHMGSHSVTCHLAEVSHPSSVASQTRSSTLHSLRHC